VIPALLDRSRNGFAYAAGWIALLLAAIDAVFLLGFFWLIFVSELNLSGTFALNKWLALAIGTIVVAPLMLGVKRQFELMARKEKPSLRFAVAMSAYACVFFGVMFWIAKDVPFSHKDGSALQYFGVTIDGRIQLYDSAGYDTRTGEPLEKVTPEIMIAIEQQKAGQSPLAVSTAEFGHRVFDGTTGAARVWYARHPDGHFSLYDRPGYDALLGVYLKPVDREAATEILGWIDVQAKADQQRATNAALDADRNAQREKEARAVAERLAFIERYIDRGSRRVPGMSNVALRLIESNDANSESVASALDRALRERGFNVVSPFKPAFSSEGLDRQLFEGSPTLAQRLALAEHCDSVVIGSVRMVKAPRNAGGMYITEMALQLRQISSTGSRMDQTEVREKGGALDASSSVSAALEKLAESAEAELAAWPRT
jgi:hypothetical protein